MNLVHLLQHKLRGALAPIVPDPEPYAAMIRPTQDPKHGDYQANCAMSLAKVLGKKPRDVAQEIVSRLELGNELQSPEIAGPGFINLRLRPEWMAAQLRETALDERLGVASAKKPQTFVIDFSSPNVAKPMHVGHLRSTIIGDSLTRLLRFLGHTVITDNHLGDWGTQFGMLLYGYRHYLDQKAFEEDPVRELARIYIHIRSQMKPEDDDQDKATDPIAEAARQETAKLHAGDPENVRLWQMFMPACLEEIHRVYRRLDVQFDYVHGESFYNPMLPDVVRSLEEQQLARRSNGALVVFLDENEPPKEPPAMIQKRDGAFTYTTSDLACIRYRVDTWHPDTVLYVVGAPQAFHFKSLFAVARRWGYDKVQLEHIAFGSVLGEDGRTIRTRDGGSVELEDLLEEAVRRAGEVYEQTRQERLARGEDVPDLSSDERRALEEAVGLGAVKYADLSQNRTTDYKFSFSKMLAMAGNTATYMQYAYVRNRGIFRKGGVDAKKYKCEPPRTMLDTEHERVLAVQLLRLEETLLAGASERQPSAITAYLWDLAKCYSGFFQNCPVLKADSAELRESRLLLCDLTARVIQQCLALLGIRTVERM